VSTTEKVGIEAKNAPGALIRAINPFSWLYRLTVPSRPIPSDVVGGAAKATRNLGPSEAEDIVKIGATKRAEDLEKLARAAGRRATRGKRAGRAALITGLGGAGAALYKNFKEGDEEAAPVEEQP
jgi:hypothetical protein